jgi:hypothetical protein
MKAMQPNHLNQGKEPITNPNQGLIQQLGLNSSQGLSRLLLALLVKIDPENKGIELTQDDVLRTQYSAVMLGRQNIHISSPSTNDRIVIKLTTDQD